MRKTPFILLAGVIAALIIGDVIEVRFHADKLAGAPKAIAAAAQDGSMYEKVRAQAIKGKRLAERAIMKDEKQRLEVALKYVEQDSDRLRRMNEAGGGEEKLAAQAGLLEHSLDRLREGSEKVSVEDLVALKDKTKTAFATAQDTLQTLEQGKRRFENLKSRLAEVRQVLEKQIGKLADEEEGEGDVAGTTSDDEPTNQSPEPTPTPIIPLKF